MENARDGRDDASVLAFQSALCNLTFAIRLRDMVFVLRVRRHALDFDGALGENGRDGADSRKHRGQHGADDANSQRKLDDRPFLLLDDDPPHVPLVEELPDRIDQLISGNSERFGERLGHRYLYLTIRNSVSEVQGGSERFSQVQGGSGEFRGFRRVQRVQESSGRSGESNRGTLNDLHLVNLLNLLNLLNLSEPL